MAGGWIKLHRQLLEKAIWRDSTPEQKTILITLLLMANHEGKEWEWHGKQFKAEPGQFITSANSIIEKAGEGISRQNVRSALTKFKKYEFLTYESTKTGLLITIVNWGNYQGCLNEGNQDTNQEVTNTQPTGNQQVTTNKNDKKEKNYKNDKKDIISDFTNDENLKQAIEDFIQMRKTIKKPLTDRALKIILNKLTSLSSDTNIQIKILEQSIMNSWQSVFPLKETEVKKPPGNYSNQRQYDMAQLEKDLLGRG
jgi:hypothetical protein